MIELFTFKRSIYTLIVIEARSFTPLDLHRLKNLYSIVDESKGIAIAGSPETNWAIVADLCFHYLGHSSWQGVYNSELAGILIANSSDPLYVRGELIKTQLPCLQCFRETKQEILIKIGAKHPYCTKHYERSPHRAGSRKRDRGEKTA